MNYHKQRYHSKKAAREHKKKIRRLRREKKRKVGYSKFIQLLREKSHRENTPFAPPLYPKYKYKYTEGEKPKYRTTLAFLLSKIDSFSNQDVPKNDNGHLMLPEVFSLSDNYSESMFFLKRLFYVLHKAQVEIIDLDYGSCKRLDLDASICMDLILDCFIRHYNRCTIKGYRPKIEKIRPVNVSKLDKKNIRFLFSIGAFKNIRRVYIKHQDVIPFDLRIGDSNLPGRAGIKEVHETQIVDYILECLRKMRQTLTPESEQNLSKVVGEVMANAEEHSKFRYRFSIGYFEDNVEPNVESHIGIFNLVIFNFGQTIYESFQSNKVSPALLKQMKDLSTRYTRNGFIKKAEFEEETLWTLYSLQDGVTSTENWKRGNGSMRFIESFFKLKGDIKKDNTSKLVLMSGNTRIIFDGTYPIVEKLQNNNTSYKMMTFNESGDIHDKPDKEFVKFASEFFPGTMISAKIRLTYNNIEAIENGKAIPN